MPDRAVLAGKRARCDVGEEIEIQALARWLVENGFHNTPAVELPGEFSVRGGIVDIFAPDWYDPVRLEFFGDQIESIRPFEVATPAEPGAAGRRRRDGAGAHGRRPGRTWPITCRREAGSCWWSPRNCRRKAGTTWSGWSARRMFHSVPTVLERVLRFPSVTRVGHRGQLVGNDLPLADRVGRAVQRRHRQGARGARRRPAGPGSVRGLPDRGRSPAAARDLFGGTRLAAAGQAPFPARAAAKRLPAGDRRESCWCPAASCSTARTCGGRRGGGWAG